MIRRSVRELRVAKLIIAMVFGLLILFLIVLKSVDFESVDSSPGRALSSRTFRQKVK
jgi:hypothetical protein